MKPISAEANKHENKRAKGRQGGAGKAIVLGMRERGDKTKAIHDNVAAGATIYADELRGLFRRWRDDIQTRGKSIAVPKNINGMAHINGHLRCDHTERTGNYEKGL